jgi:5S rRNA maturation endonuclease (ribonuclease M5)
MIAKTFKGGRTAGGARATLAYLLNERRVGEGTAKVLRGDSELTQAIITQTAKKQKWSWSSGVLSFEELIEDREKLEEIMDDFERTFFAGLEKDQYNILWVLHEDKGRTELHYVSPRAELSTGLSYNPYFVKRDFAKKDLFQEYINLKYDLSNFKDSREIVPRPPKWRENAKKKDIRQAFDDALLPLVTGGIITSREELIYQLEEWGFELNRSGKEYISVTDENGKNHRLKGHIYAESFTSWGAVEEKIERERRTVANGVQRELTAVRAELDRIIEQQAHTNRERYRKKIRERERRERQDNRVDGAEHRQDRGVREREDTAVSQRKSQTLQGDHRGRESGVDGGAEKVEKAPHHSSPYRPYIWLDSGRIGYSAILSPSTKLERQRERDSGVVRRNAVSTDQQDIKPNNHQEQGQINDSTGTEAIRRIRAIRAEQSRRAGSVRGVAKELSGAVKAGDIGFDEGDASRFFSIAGKADRAINNYCQSAIPDYKTIEQTANKRQSARAVAIFGRAISKGISSIKSIFDRRDQGIARAVGARIKDKAMQELNRFKTQINLAEFATAFGYYKDKEKSSVNAPVMRHENGDKIIIGKDRSDGHYIYFNPNDEGDSGTIIDFVKNRTGETLGHIRKRLRSWLHNPQPQENIPVRASTKDALRIAFIWERVPKDEPIVVHAYGLHYREVEEMAKMKKVKYNKQEKAFYFMLSDLQGICGIEKRTLQGEKHIISGSEKGVFTDGNINEAERIVIFESPIDMMSYKELGNGEISDFGICTMGSIGESAEKSLEAIFERQKDAQIVIAVDNDAGGDKITNKIAEILNQVDGNLDRAVRHKPEGKDWNDDLKVQDEQQTHTQARSRGIHR